MIVQHEPSDQEVLWKTRDLLERIIEWGSYAP
jgi:hypothetical protein